MPNRREVITIDDDEASEDDNLRLERELRSSKNNATYVQEYLEGKLDSIQTKYARLEAQDARRKAENASLQAETARLQAEIAHSKAKYARLRATIQVEHLEDADDDNQSHPNSPGNEDTRSRLDDQAWSKLEGTWQEMKQQFDSKSSDWTSIDLKKKYVWGAVVSAPTTHYWTRKQPGEFASAAFAKFSRSRSHRLGVKVCGEQ
ncbi:unnamed protein product [Aureobasidium mustum]|uniref:Uncharacterized protein n=1 Tax=Aureobasidium mustum TaxID=2773714 RepID=A0A9N8PMV7_9PEZI|nr:unnamed protein product [Aureobasidium mustum]